MSENIVAVSSPKPKTSMFAFGEAEPVLDARMLFDYGYCPAIGNWYEMPYDIWAIAKLFRATSHHTSSLVVKRNILTRAYIPHPLLSRHQFSSLVTNYLVFRNAYLHITRNRLGGMLALSSRPAKYMRRGTRPETFYQLMFTQYAQGIGGLNPETEFSNGEIIQIYEPDIDQEIYGVPDYLSSVNSILLNEAATLFRRRYYKNGAHAGFILHVSDALDSQEDVDALEKALENSKGAGNFKNLMIYTPSGQKDGVKVIPLAEVAAKDEFMGIKQTSRDDQLAGHRMPPQLIGVVPQNVGGFGDIEKAARVFSAHEMLPIQDVFTDMNEIIGDEVFKFKLFDIFTDPLAPVDGA